MKTKKSGTVGRKGHRKGRQKVSSSIHKGFDSIVRHRHAKKPNISHDAKRPVRRKIGKIMSTTTIKSLPNTGANPSPALRRPNIGIWAEIRKLRILIEWMLCNPFTIQGSIGQLPLRMTLVPVGLPPSSKDITDSEADKQETVPYDADGEERMAGVRAMEILKKRHKGETIDDDDPGKDWDPF